MRNERQEPGRTERGFTLIELMVVVTIVGILAGVVAVNVRTSMMRAKMNTLKHDLRVMNDLIQQYKVDKKVFPESLDSLVEAGYMRAIPIDPFTDSDQSWAPLYDEPDPESDELDAGDQGIVEVCSGAPGIDLDGKPFAEYGSPNCALGGGY